ncbi:hypothetical protein NPIL_646531 [Nephila pilipes]|uniref:Uncharacterized protein n=1 Tax=Nephila pilipes TaxID=299642 RepID=A0A8X6UMJ8_NEPPI|nr:hypothetical protein NPIL_646531 [Nephila pilipes]
MIRSYDSMCLYFMFVSSESYLYLYLLLNSKISFIDGLHPRTGFIHSCGGEYRIEPHPSSTQPDTYVLHQMTTVQHSLCDEEERRVSTNRSPEEPPKLTSRSMLPFIRPL